MKYILKDYDKAIQYILDHGEEKVNRTGVNTLSIFGHQMRFDISQRFPIVTKRKIHYKSAFMELIWMLSGSTNAYDLEKMGTKIWNPWIDEEFEKKHGYERGELGPIYGFQMRHFGGDYKTKSGGFDQIEYVVNELKTNKNSRRIMINLWNPNDLDKMRLPPCHYSFQLSVDNSGGLSGHLVMRSNDILPGTSWNMIFYSALIYMLAQQCGYHPKELVYSVSDLHIYVDQISAAKEYLKREDVKSPILQLNKKQDIYSYNVSDFIVSGYDPLEAIKIPIAV